LEGRLAKLNHSAHLPETYREQSSDAGESSMALDPEFISILMCPESGSQLELATAEALDAINLRITNGEIETHGGTHLSSALESGLVTVDGCRLFQVSNDIPNLVMDDSIDLT